MGVGMSWRTPDVNPQWLDVNPQRVPHEDRILTLRRCGEHRDRAADQFLDPPDILDGLARQVRPGAGAGRGLAPALHILVDRLDLGLSALARREIVQFLAVEPVAGADPEGLEAVEDVELGEGNAVDPGGADRLAHQGGVEPAAAALAAGHHAELAPALPMSSPVSSWSSVGNGPSPTRVV